MTAQDLKNSILQQAVQGKLLPQNPDDEPASELLKKIFAERQRLIDEDKIKNLPQLPPISDDEKPFDIPDSWQWVRLGELYNFIDYRGKTPTKISNGVPLVTAKNVKLGYNDYSIKEYISQEEYDSRKSRGISHKGDILFTTEAPLGHVSIADLDIFSAGQRLITLQAYSNIICNKTMMFFILSDQFQKMLILHKTGTTVAGIKSDKLKKILIPLPPLAEQKRIVEKLEEILPLIERYSELEQRLTKLDKEFPGKLKKSLLQQAIQGKLTRQLSTDGDASDLLEKIRAEKSKLIAEGKMKKEKPLPPIFDDEKPFDIPDNWQWVRFENIIYNVGGKENQILAKEVKSIGKYPAISQGQKFIDGYTDEKNKLIYDVPVIIFGDHTRNVKYIDFPFVISADGAKIFKPIVIYPKFFYWWTVLTAELLRNRGYNRHYKLLKLELFPLPPLEEQKRIVERLEELLPLCDRLREKFAD